ncbi:MAG TPA: Mut7-C RNAse domain-containing protein, partial [Terrimicrobiaceae bacterium]
MSFELQLTFHGDLGRFFLSPRMRGKARIFREMREKTSVKDVIESCGVPHPEVDLIVLSTGLQKALAIDFQWQLENSGNLDIYGFPAPRDLFPSCPRLQSRSFAHFVADGHLGKLSRNLRLLGVNTSYEPHADDKRLLEIMLSENRALLTRDRRLLMHSVVRHGFCPRSSHPEEQTHEVLQRFGLLESPKSIVPFSRCLECNGLLR